MFTFVKLKKKILVRENRKKMEEEPLEIHSSLT